VLSGGVGPRGGGVTCCPGCIWHGENGVGCGKYIGGGRVPYRVYGTCFQDGRQSIVSLEKMGAVGTRTQKKKVDVHR
jgi:hypothetical protein